MFGEKEVFSFRHRRAKNNVYSSNEIGITP
jgi:hypothetical protein